MSPLDLVKFKKVWALVGQGATEGEQDSARTRAVKMAEKAGMTLEQAVKAMHAPAPGQPVNILAGFDDWMEAKEPGYKARCARERAEKHARDSARRAELLEEYGSETAIFARTEREALLFEATASLVDEWEEWTDEDDGTVHRYAAVMDGHKPKHLYWYVEDVTPAIGDAVRSAYPWPARLADAFSEVEAWEGVQRNRELFCGGEWNHYPEVQCRIALLETALTNGQPAETFEDVKARFAWGRRLGERSAAKDDEILERLEVDFTAHDARLRAVSKAAIDAINQLDHDVRDAAIKAATTVLLSAEDVR